MIQPQALTKSEPLKWAAGIGTDVWELFCAAVAGDRAAVIRLVTKDPTLVRSHYAYRTPLYFAVRENRLDVAEYLLDHGADPIGLAVNDSLFEICRDRGYADMETMLKERLERLHCASPKGEAIGKVIRARDLQAVRALLDASPELLNAGDQRLQSADPLGRDDQAARSDRRAARAGPISTPRARTERARFSSPMATTTIAVGAMFPTT